MLQVPGVTGAHLSALNLDKSMLLEQLLQQHYRGDSRRLLGELQFAFLAFLMGQSLEGGWVTDVIFVRACSLQGACQRDGPTGSFSACWACQGMRAC